MTGDDMNRRTFGQAVTGFVLGLCGAAKDKPAKELDPREWRVVMRSVASAVDPTGVALKIHVLKPGESPEVDCHGTVNMGNYYPKEIVLQPAVMPKMTLVKGGGGEGRNGSDMVDMVWYGAGEPIK